MPRIIEYFLSHACFDYLAGIHNRYPVRNVCNNAKVVRYVYYGHAQILLQLAYQVQYLCLNGNVKRGGGLVADEDLRLAGKRNCDNNTLTHTAGVLGWNLSGEVASVIVFVLWGTAEMGDLVRGALISIPKHQYESSEALGFSKIQTYLYIIIPQTVRRLIPLSINLITRMIKTTSLVLMIGVVEMLKVAQQIIEANRMSSPNAAFGVFLVVFVLYFFACWPFSVLARVLEKKWN